MSPFTSLGKISDEKGYNINIVERHQIDKVLDELQLQTSDLFSSSTATKLGNFVGATHVVVGRVYKLSPDNVRIDFRIVDVETATVKSSDYVEGPRDRESKLADALGCLIAKAVKDVYLDCPTKIEELTEKGVIYNETVTLTREGNLTLTNKSNPVSTEDGYYFFKLRLHRTSDIDVGHRFSAVLSASTKGIIVNGSAILSKASPDPSMFYPEATF